MSKVLVTNHREHAIHLNLPGAPAVVIPPAQENPLDRNEVIPGSEQVDGSFLDEVRKNVVVQHYFKEGWLRTDAKEGKSTPAPSTANVPAQQNPSTSKPPVDADAGDNDKDKGKGKK